jgi:hypothetical protein
MCGRMADFIFPVCRSGSPPRRMRGASARRNTLFFKHPWYCLDKSVGQHKEHPMSVINLLRGPIQNVDEGDLPWFRRALDSEWKRATMLRMGCDGIYSMESVADFSEKFSTAAERTPPISGPTGDRCAAERADRATRQAFPTAADCDDVRRCDDGSIDVEFYKARAYAIRRAVYLRFAQALRRRMRFVLRRAYEFICGRK